MTGSTRRQGCRLLLTLTLLLLLTACGKSASSETDSTSAPAPEASSEPVELTISAAASLTDALQDIKQAYEAENDGVALQFNFGASGALQQQIEQGAPADIFLSAATKNMQALVDGGLIEANQQHNLLSNELVVITTADSNIVIGAEKDLLRTEIQRIAIGIPESVPAGSYAKEALTAASIWDSLQPKTVQAKDVRQVLQYVETGNADAGFVYKTDALSSQGVKIALTVNPAAYSPIQYPAGIVKATQHPEEAEAFYRYLQSDEAKAIFEKYGFSMAQPSE
ncbi:molybdate ABC transporter substrate-binding protein [Paenibacillus sp. P96]|uniref:Molybdate ABC transporter substrate-binding protein n=1 Tax=Paenibacillus zeirhizosphaerae TaxID=2987519 RepID=A0ABT9FV83_9BACL|nr:molybdate ABC transporter substrate-binding protein [Paenibacillus sp. P96]MDP4098525.1 molybdate ABC transporter substrate-binding protein [Paenibacillus sp. P96]